MRACSAVVKNASAWQLSGRRPQAVRIYCFDSHERLLQQHGVKAETIQAAARVAAVMKAVATVHATL